MTRGRMTPRAVVATVVARPFLPCPPTGLADGFGQESRPTARSNSGRARRFTPEEPGSPVPGTRRSVIGGQAGAGAGIRQESDRRLRSGAGERSFSAVNVSRKLGR